MNARISTPWIALAAVLLSACGGTDTPEPVPVLCTNLSIDTVIPAIPLVSVTGWNVTYAVTATTGASVTSIQYRDSMGALTYTASPTLPFSYAMSAMPTGTPVTLVVVGTAKGSKIETAVTAVAANNPAVSQTWTRSCAQ
ncbi:MAG: hypothetical protein WCK73_09185 [Deltaproteobacteria bacterium]